MNTPDDAPANPSRRRRHVLLWSLIVIVTLVGLALAAIVIALPPPQPACTDRARAWVVARAEGGVSAPKQVAPQSAFELRSGESATVEGTDVAIAVESVTFSPMQWFCGRELWPHSTFHIAVTCAGHTSRVDLIGREAVACGHTIRLEHVEGEDQGTFLVGATRP